jgi:uncharacterized lipoprotein YmbA
MKYIVIVLAAAVLAACPIATTGPTLDVSVQSAWSVSDYYDMMVRIENTGTKTVYIDGYVRVYNGSNTQLYTSEDNYWPAALEPGEVNAAMLAGYTSEQAISYKVVINAEIVKTGAFD